jgi:hypothetical protein
MIKYNEAMGGRENENMKKEGGLTSGNKIKLWKVGRKNGGGGLIYGNKDKSLEGTIK